jgi:hypothetical protein
MRFIAQVSRAPARSGIGRADGWSVGHPT